MTGGEHVILYRHHDAKNDVDRDRKVVDDYGVIEKRSDGVLVPFPGLNWNDEAGAIYVPGGYQVRLYEKSDGTGEFMDFQMKGTYNLKGFALNSEASSMRVWNYR